MRLRPFHHDPQFLSGIAVGTISAGIAFSDPKWQALIYTAATTPIAAIIWHLTYLHEAAKADRRFMKTAAELNNPDTP